MRWVMLGLLVLHGLIHGLGLVKGIAPERLPQLTQPVSRSMGIVWLVAGLSMLVAAPLLVLAPRVFWAVALGAVVLSQIVIVTSWTDAKLGTIANGLVLLAVVHGFAAHGPWSMEAEYRRAARERLAGPLSPARVTEADLEALPSPVRCYLRSTGAVGQPRVHRLEATWRGRIRGSAQEPWMEFEARQTNFIDEPARLFHMNASRGGLPVDVLHAFTEGSARMTVKLASLVPMIDLEGPQMTRAETVTLLNDISILAPSALIDPAIAWEPIDQRSARARYTVGDETIAAVLHFNGACELVDFVSDDRLRAVEDGAQLVRERWSTPIEGYRSFGPQRVASKGVGRWHSAEGPFDYLELELVELRVNEEVGE